MTIDDAQKLIANAVKQGTPGNWADLGCGSGIFTIALRQLIQPDKIIFAIDKNYQDFDSKQINFLQHDFIEYELPLNRLNGILMANSLHYVKNKSAFIQKLIKYLSKDGIWVIVEYDTTRPNKWVPHPINYHQLYDLLKKSGFNKVEKTGESASVYNDAGMYAVVAHM